MLKTFYTLTSSWPLPFYCLSSRLLMTRQCHSGVSGPGLHSADSDRSEWPTPSAQIMGGGGFYLTWPRVLGFCTDNRLTSYLTLLNQEIHWKWTNLKMFLKKIYILQCMIFLAFIPELCWLLNPPPTHTHRTASIVKQSLKLFVIHSLTNICLKGFAYDTIFIISHCLTKPLRCH